MRVAVERSGEGLSIALVAAALLLPYIGGFPATYLMMGLSLLLIVWLVVARPKWEIGAEGWMLLGAVALLAVVFLINGTLAYATNFLMLALVVPLTVALRANAGAGNAQLVAKLALAGVAIAAVVALYQVLIEGLVRAPGIGSDEIWSAVAALLIGWVALIGREGAKGYWRYLYLAGPILGTLVVLLSGSRGPMLAIPLLFGVAFGMMRGHRRELLVLLLVVAAMFSFVADKSRLGR